jgi:multidrug efflux system membrane fusion protein
MQEDAGDGAGREVARRGRRTRSGIAAVALAIVACIAVWSGIAISRTSSAAAPAAVPPVPVTIATATTKDVPVYLTGLGTAQAFNTVTIRTQVDGQLQKIAFREGQEVKTGDLLAQIDPRPYQAALAQATAKKAQDEALLANAKHNLERDQNLVRRDFTSQQTYDTDKTLVDQLTAEVQGDAAAIDQAQVQLGFTRITSPIDGRTGILLLDVGNIVHATDSTGIVVVTQLKPISVLFTLPEDQLPEVQQAMRSGTLPVTALDAGDKDVLGTGKLMLVDNEIDTSTGTIRLKASFPNDRESLWPGQFVNVRLLVRTERNAVTVPSTAVQRGAQGLYAYVLEPDRRVQLRWLDVGMIANDEAVITKGITAGEQVVTDGQSRLEPGTLMAAHADSTAPGPAQKAGR